MTNPAKLVLVVLLFFLAMTYVRGFTATGSEHDLTFSGNAPIAYNITVSNSKTADLVPSFIAEGPFTILLKDEPADLIVPGHATKTFVLYLAPTSVLRVGDVYSASIRVASVNEADSIPLILRKQSAPLFGSDSPIGNENETGSNTGTGTGLASGVSISASSVANAGLVVIILVLIVALFARVKNRVLGGTAQ